MIRKDTTCRPSVPISSSSYDPLGAHYPSSRGGSHRPTEPLTGWPHTYPGPPTVASSPPAAARNEPFSSSSSSSSAACLGLHHFKSPASSASASPLTFSGDRRRVRTRLGPEAMAAAAASQPRSHQPTSLRRAPPPSSAAAKPEPNGKASNSKPASPVQAP